MRIKSLILQSSNLEKVHTFYQEIMGFRVIDQREEFIAFQVGYTRLGFEYIPGSTPYHVAFNIPSFQEQHALAWLKERVKILPFGEMEIVDFKNWNAKAVYFYDKEYNILEFIARRNLNVHSTSTFSAESIISVSEIGVPVHDIGETYNWLQKHFKTPIFDGNFDRFCAAGSDEGLFILIDIEKKKWFPVDDQAYASDFIIELEIANRMETISFKDGKFQKPVD